VAQITFLRYRLMSPKQRKQNTQLHDKAHDGLLKWTRFQANKRSYGRIGSSRFPPLIAKALSQ
jgi:hypothetical protein